MAPVSKDPPVKPDPFTQLGSPAAAQEKAAIQNMTGQAQLARTAEVAHTALQTKLDSLHAAARGHDHAWVREYLQQLQARAHHASAAELRELHDAADALARRDLWHPEAERWAQAFPLAAQTVRRLQQLGGHLQVLQALAPAAKTSFATLAESAQNNVHVPPASPASLPSTLQAMERHGLAAHRTFMQLLQPGSEALRLFHQGGHAMQDAIRLHIHEALHTPDPSPALRAAQRALVEQLAHNEAAIVLKAIRGEVKPAALLDRSRVREVAYHRRVNAWHPGQAVEGLLKTTAFTDADHASIRKSAHDIFTSSKLEELLRDATICDVHGVAHSWKSLAQSPWKDLLEGGVLLDALCDDPAQAALAHAGDADKLNKLPKAQLERIAMAQRIAAVTIHYAVRDSIKYGLGNWRQKASDVLRLRQGSCSGSANLATALGRAVGLPAGNVVLWVELPHYFFTAMAPNALVSKERPTVHYHTGWVMLAPQAQGTYAWQHVASDPSDQYELATGIMHLNFPSTRIVDFDGAHASVLNFPEQFVYDQVGPLREVDSLLGKPAAELVTKAMRWTFLNKVAESPNVDLPTMARRFVEEADVKVTAQAALIPLYESGLSAYRALVETLIDLPSTRAQFPDKLGTLLERVLQSPPVLRALCALPPVNAELLGKLWKAFEHRAHREQVPPPDRDDDINGVLSTVATALLVHLQQARPSYLARFADAAIVARQVGPYLENFGAQTPQRLDTLARLVLSTHQLITT